MQYREANGAFKTLSDLSKVKGIGDKTVELNKEDILFSSPN
ncbi:MAG: ComEA family DNA-binding protein [Gammaproteobacteria bacterium]